MTHLTLEFPALVTPGGETGFEVQPLLFAGPQAAHRRYEKALTHLRREVRRAFADYELDRDTLEQLLWYRLAPDVHFRLAPIEVRFGRRWIVGKVATARYRLGDDDYLCLPKLAHRTLMLAPGAGSAARDAVVHEATEAFLKTLRREHGDDADPGPYLSRDGESVTVVSTGVDVPAARFPFQHYPGIAYDSLAGFGEVDGGTALAHVGHNLNERYPDELARAQLRGAETAQVRDTLFQPTARCLAIVGPRGAGKTTIIETALAGYLDQHGSRRRARAQRLWRVDPPRVIAGMSVIGMWQRRFEAILEHLRTRLIRTFRQRRGDVLYVDNVVALFRVGKSAQNTLTLADVLKPHLERRGFPMVVEATPEEWDRATEHDRRFTDLFEVLRIEAPDAGSAAAMLAHVRAALEEEHECRFTTAAFAAVIRLSRRAAGDEVMPGAAARVLARLALRHARGVVDEPRARADFRDAHRFSEWLVDTATPVRTALVRARLDHALVGQEAAKQSLIEVVQTVRAQLGEPGRPLSSLLFVGPTGVGKTEAAKVLTDLLFTDRDQIVRFDMNEYVDGGAVARLIGDVYQPSGELTAQVRDRRACVVLLDEIEKAHPRVHDLLLQLLDDGRLTDALGQTTDFSQCVVIMTSNLGARDAVRPAGFTHNARDTGRTYLEAVERFFRPELVNRIDRRVVFEPLELGEAVELARLQLERLLTRDGFLRRTVFLDVGTETLGRVAREGFDGELGGRALKRSLEARIAVPSAEKLIGVAPGRPLLLSIRERDGAIHSLVHALDYAAREAAGEIAPGSLPEAFAERATAAATLRTRVETCIDAANDAGRLVLWVLRDRVTRLAEALDQVCWDVDGWRRSAARRQPFKLRRRSRLQRTWKLAGSPDGMHAEPAEVLARALENGAALADAVHPFWLQLDVEFRLLQRLVASHEAGAIDRAALTVAPMIDGGRDGIAEHLSQHYRDTLEQLEAVDLETRIHDRERVITASGAGLLSLLERERGVHLFTSRDSPTVPVRVTVSPVGDRSGDASAPGPMLRVYRLGERPAVLDLRSALTCTGELGDEDRLLLLLGTGPHS